MLRTLKDISNRVFRHRGSFSHDVTQLECNRSGQSMRSPATVRYERMIHEMRYELNAAGRFLDSPVPVLLWSTIFTLSARYYTKDLLWENPNEERLHDQVGGSPK